MENNINREVKSKCKLILEKYNNEKNLLILKRELPNYSQLSDEEEEKIKASVNVVDVVLSLLPEDQRTLLNRCFQKHGVIAYSDEYHMSKSQVYRNLEQACKDFIYYLQNLSCFKDLFD